MVIGSSTEQYRTLIDGKDAEEARGEKEVLEALGSLSRISEGYGRCVIRQKEERLRWQRAFETWAEVQMREVEDRVLYPSDSVPNVVETKVQELNPGNDVVADVMLQHKERILDEMAPSDEIWYLQVDWWGTGCHICRIREGRRVFHDWRDCPKYPDDRVGVQQAHTEIEMARTSIEAAGQVGGFCRKCKRMRQHCWMRLRSETKRTGCRYSGAVTESVAAILGTDIRIVREWEERRGGPRGARERSELDEDAGPGRYGARAVWRLWQTFGWIGTWDIERVGVDGLAAAYMTRLQEAAAEEREEWNGGKEATSGSGFGVWNGEIGGRGRKERGEEAQGPRCGSEFVEVEEAGEEREE